MSYDTTQILGDISEAIRQVFENKWSGSVYEFSLNDNPESVRTPAYNVAVRQGNLRKLTVSKYACDVRVGLVLLFRHARSEELVRKGIYPLIMGVMALMAGRYLSVTDGQGTTQLPMKRLKPVAFRQILDNGTALGYMIEFTSECIVDAVDEEIAEGTITLALEYLAASGDDAADVATETEY